MSEWKAQLQATYVEHSRAWHALILAAPDNVMERTHDDADALLSIGQRLYSRLDDARTAEVSELRTELTELVRDVPGQERLSQMMKRDLRR
jgi:hypothetical protein